MELYLVRHAQSAGNESHTNEGWEGGALTELGRTQAKAVAERFAAIAVDAVLSSDLARAEETAAAIAERTQAPLSVSPEFREWNLGVYEGTPYGTIYEKAAAAGLAMRDFPIEGGETIPEFKGRVERAIDDVCDRYADQTVVLVTHGGFVLNAILYLLDLPDERYNEYDPDNTGVAYLTVNGSKAELHYQNDTSHLR